MSNKFHPLLVYSNGCGQVFNHANLLAIGVSGKHVVDIPSEIWIPLPNGSQLMELPGRLPVGKNPDTDEIITLASDEQEKIIAVAAFIAPAYTVCYHAVYERLPDAPILPLYAYSAVGWHNGQFYVPALRIDESIRQNPSQFNKERIEKSADWVIHKYPQNRLAEHLVNNCALTYHCPAALNFLMNRWEMPLPSSQVCNSDCLGCISLQEDSSICSAQFRIEFTPTAKEIIEIAVPHLETAPEPIVSFGQGCEGEPLMNAQLLIDTVRGIRHKTSKGTINLNTNASRPDIVLKLREAGLDSMRVSLNSARQIYYERYFRPKGYSFDDVLNSIRQMKSRYGFVALNLFVFPGFTDQPEEVEALERLLKEYQIDMIQWRNLNIDPEWYWDTMKPVDQEGIGIRNMIDCFKEKFPDLLHGYFNPCLNS